MRGIGLGGPNLSRVAGRSRVDDVFDVGTTTQDLAGADACIDFANAGGDQSNRLAHDRPM